MMRPEGVRRLVWLAGAAIATTVAVMVRQTGRARDEAELWALATEPESDERG